MQATGEKVVGRGTPGWQAAVARASPVSSDSTLLPRPPSPPLPLTRATDKSFFHIATNQRPTTQPSSSPRPSSVASQFRYTYAR